jgi:hypothetical protein
MTAVLSYRAPWFTPTVASCLDQRYSVLLRTTVSVLCSTTVYSMYCYVLLLVFLLNDKTCTDLNYLALFCELGLKMLGPQQWQLLHVER